MKRCEAMVGIGRRRFLSGAGLATVGAAVASVLPAEAKAAAGQALVAYPSNRLANIKDLRVNEPLNVAYPDADAPGVVIKLGTKVDGGVGPDGDIVGFTTVCPHKGFPLGYNASDKTLNCPGHYSRFDVERWFQLRRKRAGRWRSCRRSSRRRENDALTAADWGSVTKFPLER